MNCCKCGIPYLGIALDGKPYCHKPECINWKLELQRHRDKKAGKR